MRYKEKALEARAPKLLVVECRDPCLSRPRWGDYEISKMPTLALCIEGLEYFYLERLRLDMDAEPVRRWYGPRLILRVKRGLKTVTIYARVVGFELRLIPILFKSSSDLANDPGVLDLGDPNIPLESVKEGRVSEVRRPHIRRVVPGVPVE